jgi:hypothetical protein
MVRPASGRGYRAQEGLLFAYPERRPGAYIAELKKFRITLISFSYRASLRGKAEVTRRVFIGSRALPGPCRAHPCGARPPGSAGLRSARARPRYAIADAHQPHIAGPQPPRRGCATPRQLVRTHTASRGRLIRCSKVSCKRTVRRDHACLRRCGRRRSQVRNPATAMLAIAGSRRGCNRFGSNARMRRPFSE